MQAFPVAANEHCQCARMVLDAVCGASGCKDSLWLPSNVEQHQQSDRDAQLRTVRDKCIGSCILLAIRSRIRLKDAV